MLSPSLFERAAAIKKTASPPSVGSSSKQPAASTSPISDYRLGTAVMMAPNFNATVEASGDDPGPLTPPARVLPEHILSSEDNNRDDSDSAYSSFSATHALVDGGNNTDSTSSSAQASNSNGAPLRPKAKAPKKTLGKRARADSNANSAISTGAAVKPAKKRVRSNALMRSAPRATAAVTPGSLAGNSEFMNFTATIFIIQLGSDGPQFHAHESVLKRSPRLAEEIDRAKANKRATKQNTLALMTHDAIAFEQMLQFLYKDKFLMSENKNTALARLGELKELMSLAKHYVLPSLQKQVVKLFSSSKILGEVAPGVFFDWAEDMYHEELDHDNGPFKVYFSKVAPMLMKGANEATWKDLARMVKQGGGFAQQLFVAAATALDMQIDLTAVKKEEAREKSSPTRSHTAKGKGKGKEPVRKIAGEEASDPPEDEPTDDDEHIFLRIRPTPLSPRNGNIAGSSPSSVTAFGWEDRPHAPVTWILDTSLPAT
ncbi:MAG: hypothetical protein ALECFALPRED_007814 [Alectoria fallacina]|uniref:BTB domain-containing protein n=1 Tax=Alectoria fallacina TaxID=1903189 RepID=A0A8H3J0X4_9LECA|nr:MAG: hypothetical protein ALECFALPRED_007814 [Alectoria fallacina]